MSSRRLWAAVAFALILLVPIVPSQSEDVEESTTAADHEYQDPLLRKLSEALLGGEGNSEEESDSAEQILREADGILARVREENRRGLEAANRQVRIVGGCRTPNIVLCLLDDVGYGDLGCYGQRRILTPCIDMIAATGTLFAQFYAGSSVSVASRGVLLSGKLAARGTVVDGACITVRESDVTVAEMLYQGGYETALFGLWDAGPREIAGDPNSQGFREFYGYLDSESAEDYYPDFLWHNAKKDPLPGNQDGASEQYAPDLIVEKARDFIAHRTGRPFFVTIAFPMAITGSGSEVPDYGVYAENDWPDVDKAKAAMLSRVDRYIGEILVQLKESGCAGRTLIIITSDNGPDDRGGVDLEFLASASALRGKKADLYEGGIRVPMITCWAGIPRTGGISNMTWAMWDMLPTLADLSSTLLRPSGTDGVSLLARLARDARPGASPAAPPFLSWEKRRGGFSQAARLGDWKSVRDAEDGPWELYNLSTDVVESQDVASQFPDVVQSIEKRLDESSAQR